MVGVIDRLEVMLPQYCDLDENAVVRKTTARQYFKSFIRFFLFYTLLKNLNGTPIYAMGRLSFVYMLINVFGIIILINITLFWKSWACYFIKFYKENLLSLEKFSKYSCKLSMAFLKSGLSFNSGHLIFSSSCFKIILQLV